MMTLQQAEIDLRMAALAFARARDRFHAARADREIRAECDAYVNARIAVLTAALALAEAVEHRVSP